MDWIRAWCVVIMMIAGINTTTYGYTFGMLSPDDTADSISSMEEVYGLSLPMVSFIRDGYGIEVQQTLAHLPDTLWTDRIYHITLSPELSPEQAYTSAQVVWGYFDREYEQFFKTVKRTGIKVIFRTMHEMNGWRYPWSGDPASFKQARTHVYQLSREAWLDQSQILFDFSVNGWDMPVLDWEMSHQWASLIECDQTKHNTSWCLTWEDYYPWDAYIDLMWVTFYNRGKATSNRQRLTPSQIMDEWRFNIRNRLVASGKPIIVDEVGTTSVRYQWSYDRAKSLQSYTSKDGQLRKNIRLKQLSARAWTKSDLVALSYFNVDRTIWLSWNNPWEADRSAIDLENQRYYSNIMLLYQNSDNDLNELFTPTTLPSQVGSWTIKKWWDAKPPLNKASWSWSISITLDKVASKKYVSNNWSWDEWTQSIKPDIIKNPTLSKHVVKTKTKISTPKQVIKTTNNWSKKKFSWD